MYKSESNIVGQWGVVFRKTVLSDLYRNNAICHREAKDGVTYLRMG